MVRGMLEKSKTNITQNLNNRKNIVLENTRQLICQIHKFGGK